MRVLLFRFSAMGDVALLVPVIHSFLETYQNVELIVFTKKAYINIFPAHPRLKIIGFDFKAKGSSFLDLFRASLAIKPHIVLDLHAVLRTYFLGFLLSIWGKKVFTLKKERKKRKSVLAGGPSLKPVSSKYLEVFHLAGFPFSFQVPVLRNFYDHKTVKINAIGIAPFAAHKTKIWDLANYQAIFTHFQKTNPNTVFYVFGGGKNEKQIIDNSFLSYKNVVNTIGTLSLTDELSLMSSLKVVLSMDSANMHLAYLCGVPVLSIWGSTKSTAGFSLPEHAAYPRVEDQELSCRPCSIYGNTPCHRGDHACMKNVSAGQVIKMLETFI